MKNTQLKNQKEVALPTEVSQRRAGEGKVAVAQVHSAHYTKFPS